MDPELLDALGTTLLVGGGVLATGAAATVGTVWYGVRRLKRSRRLRRGLDRGGSTVRMFTGDAATRSLAGQRLRIERAMDATDHALQAAAQARRPVGQLPVLAEELRASGQELSRQLRVAEAEPHADLRARLARQLQEPVDRFLRVSGDLRAATISGPGASDGRLEGVAERLGIEMSALDAWDEVYGRRGSHAVEPPELPNRTRED